MAILAGACSEGAGRGATRARAAVERCPDEQFISSAVGFPVRSMRHSAAGRDDGVLICGYQAIDPAADAFVSIAAAPLSPGEDALAEVRSAAEATSGAEGIDIPDVGERGFAYGSPSKSAAAAIRASRVYHVDLTARTPIGSRRDAVIAILRRVVG
jgi:hypothetical protein